MALALSSGAGRDPRSQQRTCPDVGFVSVELSDCKGQQTFLETALSSLKHSRAGKHENPWN